MIIIPSRLASTRLPRKPLALIQGEPLIVHVWKRAQDIMETLVATCCEEIAEVITKRGGNIIITPPEIACGTDRVCFAAQNCGRPLQEDSIIVNLQGDIPYFEPELIYKTLDVFNVTEVDIATAMHPMSFENADNPAYVKVAFDPIKEGIGKALYFSRNAIPYGSKNLYKHIGIYAYRFHALKKFVQEPVTFLEQSESLEQLRALHLGFRIGVATLSHEPASVDTPKDLEAAINKIEKGR